MAVTYVGIGSNINAQENVARAVQFLRDSFDDVAVAPLYESAPMGYADQDPFINTVVRFESLDADPFEIKAILEYIEDKLGKNTQFANGPRTIDLDLLLFRDDSISEPSLTVPHPRMHERRFVLEPLCELIDGNALHPTLGKTWSDLLAQVMDQECRKL